MRQINPPEFFPSQSQRQWEIRTNYELTAALAVILMLEKIIQQR